MTVKHVSTSGSRRLFDEFIFIPGHIVTKEKETQGSD